MCKRSARQLALYGQTRASSVAAGEAIKRGYDRRHDMPAWWSTSLIARIVREEVRALRASTEQATNEETK